VATITPSFGCKRMSTVHSTNAPAPIKPAKPSPDFPLFPHATKRWAKKIKGKFHYFGPWDDPRAALRAYQDFIGGKLKAAGRTGPVPAATSGKPAKPYPDFPLFAHATGRWAKKIRGGLVYFGKWDDPDAALARYLAEKDDLHAGRSPRESAEKLTVYTLCGRFLTAKKQLLDAGELKSRTFAEYTATCRRLTRSFGKHRPVADLRPDDFERLRGAIAKQWGPVRLGTEITRIRGVFRYAVLAGLVDRPVPIGPAFAKPSARVLRLHRLARGPRAFVAADLRTLLASAGPPLKAMILLGVNCGFGNLDVGTLPQSDLDLSGGWVNYPRPKTGIVRRCPLWPETVAAVRKALAERPAPKDERYAGLAFMTRWGRPWATGTPADAIGPAFQKLCRRCGVTPRGFYGLRHTFQTIGDESGDFLAVRAIMGHTGGNDIADHYRERLSDRRLLSVTEHVRGWLFGAET
jgi:integrase